MIFIILVILFMILHVDLHSPLSLHCFWMLFMIFIFVHNTFVIIVVGDVNVFVRISVVICVWSLDVCVCGGGALCFVLSPSPSNHKRSGGDNFVWWFWLEAVLFLGMVLRFISLSSLLSTSSSLTRLHLHFFSCTIQLLSWS